MLKSLYVSAFITACWVGAIWAGVLAAGGLTAAWGEVFALGVPALFFARLFVAPVARTSANLWWMPAAGLAGAAFAAWHGGTAQAIASLLIGTGGSLLYIFWYSRFGAGPAALAPGERLPDFELIDSAGETVHSKVLAAKPAVWLFFRGNWCPLCMAQIREIAAQYRALNERGVELLLVTPQPEANTRKLAQRFEVPMRFFTDRDNAAARALGIVVEGGLPAGLQALGYDSDVPRPTVLITDAGGRILHSDLSDNYRVRPEPDAFLHIIDRELGTPA